jgi:hypothetical protein
VGELRDALGALSIAADTAQTVAIMRRFDEDGNGKLELTEFRALVGELRRYQIGGGRDPDRPLVASGVTVGAADYWEQSVPATFKRFDRDGRWHGLEAAPRARQGESERQR